MNAAGAVSTYLHCNTFYTVGHLYVALGPKRTTRSSGDHSRGRLFFIAAPPTPLTRDYATNTCSISVLKLLVISPQAKRKPLRVGSRAARTLTPRWRTCDSTVLELQRLPPGILRLAGSAAHGGGASRPNSLPVPGCPAAPRPEGRARPFKNRTREGGGDHFRVPDRSRRSRPDPLGSLGH